MIESKPAVGSWIPPGLSCYGNGEHWRERFSKTSNPPTDEPEVVGYNQPKPTRYIRIAMRRPCESCKRVTSQRRIVEKPEWHDVLAWPCTWCGHENRTPLEEQK